MMFFFELREHQAKTVLFLSQRFFVHNLDFLVRITDLNILFSFFCCAALQMPIEAIGHDALCHILEFAAYSLRTWAVLPLVNKCFGAIESLWYFNIKVVGQTRLDCLARDHGSRVLKLRCGEPSSKRDFMRNSRIDDISGFPCLQSLHIAHDGTNAVMLTIPHTVRHLSFSDCFFDDRGLQSLPSANLQSLSLCECPNVTDAGLSHFENLRHLRLNYMEGIHALSFPPKLKSVFLDGCSRVITIPAVLDLHTLSVQFCHRFQGSAVTFLPNLHVLRVKHCQLVQGASRIAQEHLERGRVLVEEFDPPFGHYGLFWN